ncbi:23S rRNA (guanosine(2251)-2'-O)-methyltransferase RlmB [candidate division KSB1 bacterium]|nr:23S rRNA (guanosine(2251)-2'-O)-methyltransferase RlmB [candidate division KSB1 bacterium]
MNIIYGKNAVIEALNVGQSLEKIFIARGLKPGNVRAVRQAARRRNVSIREVNRRKIDDMTGNNHHQGIMAIVPRISYHSIEDIFEVANKKNEPPLISLLDEIQDPHNLGAIVRSAEAFGLHGIIIPKNRSVGLTDTVAKTSAGAIHHLPVARVTNLSQIIEELKSRGLWIVGADQHSEQRIQDVDLTMPLGIVIGSEGKGIRRLIREKCDFLVQIPMCGKINSLNASVAAALIFWEVHRKKI